VGAHRERVKVPAFASLLFVAVVTIVVGRVLLPYAVKNRGGERR
jgi:lipopolysaccharide export LptBFGC system permease protein LptF